MLDDAGIGAQAGGCARKLQMSNPGGVAAGGFAPACGCCSWGTLKSGSGADGVNWEHDISDRQRIDWNQIVPMR